MKKLLLAATAIIAISTTSCKKDWTCECTDDNGYVFAFQIQDSRRPEASTICNTGDLAGQKCKLK